MSTTLGPTWSWKCVYPRFRGDGSPFTKKDSDHDPMRDKVADVLNDYMKETGLTFREISIDSGLSESTLRRLADKKTRRPQGETYNFTLRSCKKALGIVDL